MTIGTLCIRWIDHFLKTADGLAMMEEDKAYTRRHGYGSESTLDQMIVKAVTNWSFNAPAFFDVLTKILVR